MFNINFNFLREKNSFVMTYEPNLTTATSTNTHTDTNTETHSSDGIVKNVLMEQRAWWCKSALLYVQSENVTLLAACENENESNDSTNVVGDDGSRLTATASHSRTRFHFISFKWLQRLLQLTVNWMWATKSLRRREKKKLKSTFDVKCNLQWYILCFHQNANNNSQLLWHRSLARLCKRSENKFKAAFSLLLFHLILIETIFVGAFFSPPISSSKCVCVWAVSTIITGFRLHLCKRVECVYLRNVANKLLRRPIQSTGKMKTKTNTHIAHTRNAKLLCCANVCKLLL